MDLSKILSISGKPGLYKHIAQSKTGIVVESVSDGKRGSAFASDQISSLSDISIFTTDEDIKLEDVLKKIYDKEEGKKAISPKSSSAEIKTYFEEVLPEYDKDRVYVSDIKKVLKWYNLLSENNILEFKEEKEEKKDDKVKDDEKTSEKDKEKKED
ncbi:MAG: DUF5606 domain-containing protein [Bacteroidales bacterium]|nr:DUF5606 domain-containing protein [Bacteroidales bacterium]